MAALLGLIGGLRTLRAYDNRREGVPGEHWAVFGSALTLYGASRSIRSPLLRTATALVAGLLLLRAVSGRDGAVQRIKDGASARRSPAAP